MQKSNIISRRVWVLSLVSLFTDMASEMLYPVMPLYLKEVGFTIIGIGILEGLAEAIAGISKGYFGMWSDSSGKRVPFIRIGYSLSALSKPMMALFTFPLWIFLSRTVDRIGKGVRTGARDALLSAESTPSTKGSVFGFHRSMDTIGAFLGPALALLFLFYHPGEYRSLFLWALLPGLLAIGCTFWLKESSTATTSTKKIPSPSQWLGFWVRASSDYKKITGALLVFALVNSSDVFLLLQLKANGVSDIYLIGIYIFYNAIYALFAYPLGIIADKLGMKKMLCIGLLLFAMVYAFVPFVHHVYYFVLLFFIYGVYAAATEGIAKAWISNICDKTQVGTALGTFSGMQSLATLLASSFAGWLWFQFGSTTTFVISSLISFLVALFVYFRVKETPINV
jgi:MFS family permease